MTTLAITGATGFVGGGLVQACASRSDLRLKLLVRNPAAAAPLAGAHITLHQGDLTDPESLRRFLAPGDTLVHLAYLDGQPTANVQAVTALATAARAAGVRRVVHCSTALVVGTGRARLVDESTVPEPTSDYQVTKLELERLFREGLGPEVPLAILRPTEVMGPGGEGLREMVARVRSQSPARAAVYRMILGSRRFNYVCVQNVAAALLTLVDAPLASHGEVFNLSDDDDPDNSYAAVEALIHQALGDGRRVWAVPSVPLLALSLAYRWLLPTHAPPQRRYDATKIHRLGYSRVTTLRETIPQLVAFERQRSAGSIRVPTPGRE